MKRFLLLLTAFCMATFNIDGQVFSESLAQRRYLLGGLRVTLVIVHPQMLLGKVQKSESIRELAEFQINSHHTLYAMWVDGSSPYNCAVSMTTDSIDVSSYFSFN